MLNGSDLDKLMQRLIIAESSGNPKAIGDNGNARGLMQIQKNTWNGLTKEPFDNAFNPESNVQVGRHLLENIAQSYNYDTDIPHVAYQFNSGHHITGPLPNWTKTAKNKVYREIYNPDYSSQVQERLKNGER